MSQLRWQKSSFSESGTENCVELASDAAGTPHLRESDDPARVVTTSRPALGAFLRAVKAGKLDGLAG